MKGRKPNPTAVKELTGNPGKRALNDREPQPPRHAALFDVVPPELVGNEAAITYWNEIAPMLRDIKQITAADRTALVAFCIEYAIFIEAAGSLGKRDPATGRLPLLIKNANGTFSANPYLGIAHSALKQVKPLLAELGLTPSSRSRLTVDGGGLVGDDFDEFDEEHDAGRPN